MPKVLNLEGLTFGRLFVIHELPHKTKHRQSRWLCHCECGALCAVIGSSMKNGSTVSCGCFRHERLGLLARSRTGNNSPRWKGGRITDQGYVYIYRPQHPKASKKGYVMEHRLVVETKLGRLLFPNENVHHINGIRNDNRPENLELWVTTHPSGQRPEDLVAWAKEILARYNTGITIS